MPGDGITDVGPIAQNQETGRRAATKYRSRVAEYGYVDGWIQLLWEWWPPVQDTANYPYLTRRGWQRDPRLTPFDGVNAWFLSVADVEVASQVAGVQPHGGVALPRRRPRVTPSSLGVEETTDPTTVSNVAAWFPGIDGPQAAYARRKGPARWADGVPRESWMPPVAAIPTTFGDVHYTGGGIVVG